MNACSIQAELPGHLKNYAESQQRASIIRVSTTATILVIIGIPTTFHAPNFILLTLTSGGSDIAPLPGSWKFQSMRMAVS